MKIQSLNSVHAWCKRAVNVIGVLLIVMLFAWFAIGALVKNTWINDACKYVVVALFFLFLLFTMVVSLLSLFVKNDGDSELEDVVDTILRKKQEQNRSVDSQKTVFSPLKGMDEACSQLVCCMLQDLPPHHADAQKINLAMVAQFLTALKKMDLLNDADRANLRLWVGQVTNKVLPSVREFNEAYPSNTTSKVNRYMAQIQEAFSKTR